MHKSDLIFISIIFILIIGFIGYITYNVHKKDLKCTEKGGLVIKTNSGTVCAKIDKLGD